MSKVSAFLRISRLEFLAGGGFFLFAVAGIGAGSWPRLSSNLPWVGLGCLLWVFCHLLGSQVNCLADYELDRAYKSHLPEAIDVLGRERVVWAIVLESLGGGGISLLFSLRAGSWVPFLLYAVGWALALGYSLEPARLKKRGLLNPLALVLVLYGLPVSFGYLALAEGFAPMNLLFFLGVGLQMFAAILLNPVEDLPEDRAARISTPVVRYGLQRVVTWALLSYVGGTGAASWALFSLVGHSWWAVAILVGVLGGHLWMVGSIGRLARAVHEEQALRAAGRANPIQFAVIGATVGAAAALVLVQHP